MSWETRAQKIVDNLTPEDDWWKSSTPDYLYSVAISLLVEGVEDHVVEGSLSTIINALRQEYGE